MAVIIGPGSHVIRIRGRTESARKAGKTAERDGRRTMKNV